MQENKNKQQQQQQQKQNKNRHQSTSKHFSILACLSIASSAGSRYGKT